MFHVAIAPRVRATARPAVGIPAGALEVAAAATTVAVEGVAPAEVVAAPVVAVVPVEAEVTPADMGANQRCLAGLMASWKFSDAGGKMKARRDGKSAPGIGYRI